MRIHVSRWVSTGPEDNLGRMAEEVRAAVAGGAELVVFPELFLTGYRGRLDPAVARDRFARLSADHPRALLVMGSISEGERNRMTVWAEGDQMAAYDKVHLFRPNREHEMWTPGDEYVALRWRGLVIGLLNCNDVRFPEQARTLKLEAGAHLLVAPAWWPWRRDHIWRMLLGARAAENGCWVVGCAISGSVHPDEPFAGAGNHVFDPLGEPVRTADDVTYELGLESPPELVVDPAEQAVDVERVRVEGLGD